MKHTVNLQAARMRLRNSQARLEAIRRMPTGTPAETAKANAALKEFWSQINADKLLVYGPNEQGYHGPARKGEARR